MTTLSNTQRKLLEAMAQEGEALRYTHHHTRGQIYYSFTKVIGRVPYRTVQSLVKKGLAYYMSGPVAGSVWQPHQVRITARGRKAIL